jgi:hypothetical protein
MSRGARKPKDMPESLWEENGHVEGEYGALLSEFEKAPDGADVLERLIRFIRRYVALSEDQALLSALWIFHTHALDAADTTPYLNVKSAEKRSGKTRLLEVLSLLAAGSWLTGRVTAAVLVRKVAAEAPALLLDESDAAFKGDREYAETLRGVLNAGFRRGGVASLCVGQGANITYEDFLVYCPKVIAGIGKLPDTVADRSIPIELRRRRPSEMVEWFRLRKVGPEALPISRDVRAWAQSHLDSLSTAEPDLPEELDDRAQDIMEPLLAIADEVGGEWPERSRRAAVGLLTGEEREDAESLGVRLLRNVRGVFDDNSSDRLPTGKLLEALHAMEEAPWGSLRGEALDARGLARLLTTPSEDTGGRASKMPGYGICPRSREKRNTWNIRNIPPIEWDLMFHINKMFRNVATTWNTKRPIKRAMFHVFRKFRMMRSPANVR